MTLFSPSFLHELLFNNFNWASEASPKLGCSTEISRDICICVGRSVGMSVVSKVRTWNYVAHVHAQSHFGAVETDL